MSSSERAPFERAVDAAHHVLREGTQHLPQRDLARVVVEAAWVHLRPKVPEGLLPFDPWRDCPKCLAPEGATFRHHRGVCVPTSDGFYDVTVYSSTDEHLHRTCVRCGYEWLEQTADADG